jgi:hypothetical protein
MVLSNPIFVADKRSQRSTNTFFSFFRHLRRRAGNRFLYLKFYDLPLSEQFQPSKTKFEIVLPPSVCGRSNTDFFLSLKFFFLLMNLFCERPTSPRTNGKIGNFIYYTWKTFFKATRKKVRSNTDIYNIFFYQTLSYCLSFFSWNAIKEPSDRILRVTTVYWIFSNPFVSVFSYATRQKSLSNDCYFIKFIYSVCERDILLFL